MARKQLGLTLIDNKAYSDAETSFRLANELLPPDHVADLAQEVVRRLAFRMPAVRPPKGFPDDNDIERFCAALLSSEEDAADRIILSVRQDGDVDIQTVYLGYIAGASRKLGKMWESDHASFMEVSLGTGRLYRMIRGLRHVVAPAILEGRRRMPALFVAVPGETHTLGIEMAVDLFRRDGGDADVCIGKSYDEILTLSETRHYGVVVLVANTDNAIPALIRLSVGLRISQPLTPFALAGNLVDNAPNSQSIVGAELIVRDMQTGIVDLRRLTENG